MVKRRLVTVGNKKVHFYIMGDGPALVMFHPSPHSAELLLPLAKELAFDYTVICVDMPGYGKSEELEIDPKSLSDYTVVLHNFFREINVEQPLLYGSATGAQLAIRYALDYPNDVSHVFLDNAAHFNDKLRAAILRHYFPDLTPEINGSHIRQIWIMVNRMFQYFPWCFTEEEYALNRPQLPKEALHIIALDFLKAGGIYHLAYKAAFIHEKGEYVQQLKVPTTIFRWKGSIIKKHIDDLLAFDFPEFIEAVSIPEGHTERNLEMIKQIRKKKEGVINYHLPEKFNEEPEQEAVIERKTPQSAIPEISNDGAHFFDAWEILKRENPNYSAQEIQSLMIQWFSRV